MSRAPVAQLAPPSSEDIERARSHARARARELGLDEATRAYEAQRWRGPRVDAGLEAAPVLCVDDVSGIPFLDDIVGVEFYQLRSRIRAGDGDLFAATCADMPEYERYNREHLGLGEAEFVHAAPPAGVPPIRVSEACRQGPALDRICSVARAHGGLLIHPYMGIEDVWALARDVARRAGVEVRVVGPPPPVTWYANDKLHVTQIAEAVVAPALDTRVTVDTLSGSRAAELVGHLDTLARSHPEIALKMTRCASAMGNRRLRAAEWRALGPAEKRALVERFLSDKQWIAGDPVLAVAWESFESSPSAQVWIPPDGCGPPVLDGLYEQLLVGPENVFLGSIPSRLSAEIEAWLAESALLVAHAYQAIGYVGRCSFDYIVTGGRPAFVECNGRWGGTSTPMHLLDRVFDGKRPAYRARDVVFPHLAGGTFGEVMRMLGPELYDRRTKRGRYILYNVAILPPHGKFDVIALGEDIEDATAALEDRLPALLGAPK